MKASSNWIYRLCRALLRLSLGFYFNRITRFHLERVPRNGPLLFTSNHPNSLTDAFVIGTSVPRKVHFVATVQLFRARFIKWLLLQAGVIPINRAKDDPRAMRTVMQSFDTCFSVLEQGEAIGIFPEGITHDDPQLKSIKSGAARMALDFEHRHGGRLGLRIVPVGLTFSAKETYRSDVLVHFGEPLDVASYLVNYPQDRRDCIHALSAEIEERIRTLILHVPKLERFRIVRAVRRLYQDRLEIGTEAVEHLAPEPMQVKDIHLTRTIARVVDFTFDHRPERAARFVARLDSYERLLRRLRLDEEDVVQWASDRGALGHKVEDKVEDKKSFWRANVLWGLLGIVGAPVAVYGWIHRSLPVRMIDRSLRRVRQRDARQTSIATTVIVAGIVWFTLCYLVYTAIFHAFFGWPATLFYELSLAPAGLFAHYYAKEFRRFQTALRAASLRFRAPLAVRRLLMLRAQLVSDVETQRRELFARISRNERGLSV